MIEWWAENRNISRCSVLSRSPSITFSERTEKESWYLGSGSVWFIQFGSLHIFLLSGMGSVLGETVVPVRFILAQFEFFPISTSKHMSHWWCQPSSRIATCTSNVPLSLHNDWVYDIKGPKLASMTPRNSFTIFGLFQFFRRLLHIVPGQCRSSK